MVEKAEIRCTAIYPTLPVKNVAETIKFYQNQLNFELRFAYREPPTHAALSLGEGTLHFFAGTPRPIGHWVYFDVAPLAKLYALYEKNGVEILDEPTVQPWGMCEFNIKDLNGYVLRFGQFAHDAELSAG